MENDAIQNTDANDHGDGTDDDSGVDAFLKSLTAADESRRKPSKGDAEATETPEEEAAEEPEETRDEAEETAEEDEEKPDDKTSVDLADDTKVKVKVDGKELEVSLGELKRLAGQEQSLTRKAMDVAEARKGFEEKATKAQATLNRLLERAEERLKPYAALDFLKLSRQLDEPAWDQLRADALAAQADVEFFKTELDGHLKTTAEAAQAHQATAAKAAVEVLSGAPEKGGIAGWNQTLYNDIMQYAVAQGLPQQLAYAVVEPAAIRMLHKAMQFDRGKTAATAQITKAKVAATKVAKPGGGSSPSGKATEALSRLARSGSDDDAVAAFMAGLKG